MTAKSNNQNNSLAKVVSSCTFFYNLVPITINQRIAKLT